MLPIKNYLPTSQEELNEILIRAQVASTPFKIGDHVYFLEDNNNEKWTITDFTVTADDEPAALLENDTFHTFALLEKIKFYYH